MDEFANFVLIVICLHWLCLSINLFGKYWLTKADGEQIVLLGGTKFSILGWRKMKEILGVNQPILLYDKSNKHAI